MSLFSTFRWNCNLLPKFGKTQSHLINCVLFICSFFQLISNPINWILFFTYSIVKFHVALSFECWSVWMDSNHRPRAYQARALATWATDRFFFSGFFSSSIFKVLTLMVEMKGIEPLTPCLQGRCSPSWATPPSGCLSGSSNWILTIEQQIL